MSTRLRLSKYATVWIVLVTVGALVVVHSPDASAKMYKWTDNKGKTHYTDSPAKIPRRYRDKDKVKTLKEKRSVSNPVQLRFAPKKGKSITVPIEPHGAHHMVNVTINDTIKAKLLLDTGASMISLSQDFMGPLGVSPDGPKMTVSTAGGKVQVPMVNLKKVQVGDAVVRNVEAALNPHHESGGGLLGKSFLNEFKWHVDQEAHLLIMTPKETIGAEVYGGKKKSWWVEKFRDYSNKVGHFYRIGRAWRVRDGETGKVRGVTKEEGENWRKQAEYYKKLYEELDHDADKARFPKELRVPLPN